MSQKFNIKPSRTFTWMIEWIKSPLEVEKWLSHWLFGMIKIELGHKSSGFGYVSIITYRFFCDKWMSCWNRSWEQRRVSVRLHICRKLKIFQWILLVSSTRSPNMNLMQRFLCYVNFTLELKHYGNQIVM